MPVTVQDEVQENMEPNNLFERFVLFYILSTYNAISAYHPLGYIFCLCNCVCVCVFVYVYVHAMYWVIKYAFY